MDRRAPVQKPTASITARRPGAKPSTTTTTGAATSFVYTGTGESAGQPPTAGTKWVSKISSS